MKIEKLNDNQIRCILDKSDLEERKLHLSELAYGSTKAKELFRDMMEQANSEFGFEVENIPLMIEAIPVSMECLILVVTKVEDPEELDTRFSRFSSMLEEGADMEMDEDGEFMMFGHDNIDFETSDDDEIHFGGSYGLGTDLENEFGESLSFGGDSDQAGRDQLGNESANREDSEEPAKDADGMNILEPFNQAISKAKKEALKKKQAAEMPRAMSDQIYAFDNLEQVIRLSCQLKGFYQGDSMLYKDTTQEVYYLVLLRDETDEELYKRACNLCADHGEVIVTSYATMAYFEEHFQMICEGRAVEVLSQLG